MHDLSHRTEPESFSRARAQASTLPYAPAPAPAPVYRPQSRELQVEQENSFLPQSLTANLPASQFKLDFEPTRYTSRKRRPAPPAVRPPSPAPSQFRPPTLVERFKTPVRPAAPPYPFYVPEPQSRPVTPETVSRREQQRQQADIQSFTNTGNYDNHNFHTDKKKNYDTGYESRESESGPARRTESPLETLQRLASQPAVPETEQKLHIVTPQPDQPTNKMSSLPDFTNFKPTSSPAEIKIKKSPGTKKPYLYEKKNFREPLKSTGAGSGPHQIIRIKAEQGKQGKQLEADRRAGYQQAAPGRLEIEEVVRRQEPIRPDQVQ